MLLVILGAGATHDSSLYAGSASHPPLADHLFDQRHEFGDILDLYPQVRALVDRLRAAATQPQLSIESVFESIVAEAQDRAATRRQLAAARFYIHDAIERSVDDFAIRAAHGVTNYHELVNRVDMAVARTKEPVMYVTFNYDQLLEVALDDSLGHEFAHIESYINRPERRVLKLHGSVNWRRLVVDANGGPLDAPWPGGSRELNVRWLLARYESVRVGDSYEIGAPHEFGQTKQVHFPAIAVPTEKKTVEDFELPVSHIGVLRNALPHVTQVLVIGWRGHEDHFWRVWHETRQHAAEVQMNVVVVDKNANAANDVARHLMKSGIAKFARPIETEGFSGYMAQPGLAGLLL